MARGRLGPELEVGPGGASCELCAEPYASLVLDLQGCNLSQKCPGAWGGTRRGWCRIHPQGRVSWWVKGALSHPGTVLGGIL